MKVSIRNQRLILKSGFLVGVLLLAITIWPFMLGAGIRNALLPSDSAET